MKRGLRLSSLAILGMAVLASVPAHAAYTICNKTSYVVYAALGYSAGDDIVTGGWTRVLPGACETASAEKLQASAFFLYARSSNAHRGPGRAWGGKAKLCAKAANFSLRVRAGAASCPGGDAFFLPFAAGDVRGQADWTTILTESAAIPTIEDAQVAGLQRLLNDNGFDVGAINARRNAKMDSAIVQFRARQKIPFQARTIELFQALEREAEKSAAPQGYVICNESKAPLWAAIGLREGNTWTSRGWWRIAPANCTKAWASALAGGRIYLLAERENGERVVGGSAMFCVNDASFEIKGRENCVQRRLKTAGFEEIDITGRRGYTARIGDFGLVPFAPLQATQ